MEVHGVIFKLLIIVLPLQQGNSITHKSQQRIIKAKEKLGLIAVYF